MTTTPTSPHLTEDNLRELSVARTTYRKIARAIRVAKFDGWTIALFGGLTFLAGLGDITDMAIGMILIVIAWVEITSAKRLRDLHPGSIRVLMLNQLTLGFLLILYATWEIYLQKTGRGPLAELAGSGVDMGDLNLDPMIVGFYCMLIVVAIFGMGGLAWYYFSRQKHLQKYLAETPAWIIAMQKSGLTI